MTQINICEPLRPAKTGYRRSWTDADRAVNKVSGDPVQPSPGIVTQKVSDIEYNVWNGDYQRSLTIPVSFTDKDANKDPIQPNLKQGWNGDFIRSYTATDIEINDYVSLSDITGLSEKFVKQTLYTGYYVLKETVYPAPSLLVPDEKTVYDEYVSKDICNQEVYLDGDVVVDGNGTPVSVIFVENATLCMEEDRDNVFKTEFSFQAIQLEDNTSLSHIDYTGDYFVREEGDIALSMEQGNLIEPYGL